MSEAANELLLIRKYLLGSLEGEEREQLEERVLSDAGFRDRVLLVEENLIEDYTEGVLNETERHGFQKMFYSNTQRRIEVQVVEGLKQHAATNWWTRLFGVVQEIWKSRRQTLVSAGVSPLDSFSGFRKAAIAVALVIAVAIALFVVQRFLRSEQAPSITQEQQRHDLIERELARLNPSREPQSLPSALAATLSPGLSRGDDTQPTMEFPIVTLPRGAESAQLRLLLRSSDSEYRSFQAVLTPVGARESYQVDLKPFEVSSGVPVLILTLPIQVLDDGDYSVQLTGQSAEGRTDALPNHNYYFRLVRTER
jgi:anti-sigma-K factor RskA